MTVGCRLSVVVKALTPSGVLSPVGPSWPLTAVRRNATGGRRHGESAPDPALGLPGQARHSGEVSAVSEPVATAAPPSSAARSAAGNRRSIAVALLLGVVGAAVVLTAGSLTWQHGSTGFGDGTMRVSVSGSTVTGLPGALAMVGLAALVAVFAVRGAARVVVAGLLALCGVGVIAAALLATGDTAALAEAAANATGLTRASVEGRTGTAGPVVSAVGGLLVLAAGLVALLRSRDWPGMSSRYDRDGAAPARPAHRPRRAEFDPDRPEDLWKALDRGEDPTAGDPDDIRPTPCAGRGADTGQ